MFGKKAESERTNFDKIETLIGKGTVIEGSIKAKGTIRIDGEFKGEVKTQGDMVIGESGKVEALIETRNILVGGFVKGNITASGKVDLSSSAKVYGDLKVKNLIIEEGAVFMGNCLMHSKEGAGNPFKLETETSQKEDEEHA
jgi:cytoskeletal protein CcmA (bactofilin family)